MCIHLIQLQEIPSVGKGNSWESITVRRQKKRSNSTALGRRGEAGRRLGQDKAW